MRSIVELYKQWTTTTMLNKQPASGRSRVVILYDTMYGATERMAEEIARGVRDADRIPVVLKASLETVTRTADELFSAGAIALGSPTLNNGCMPTLAMHMTFIKGLGFKGRRGNDVWELRMECDGTEGVIKIHEGYWSRGSVPAGFDDV